jgi:hypothetical protein
MAAAAETTRVAAGHTRVGFARSSATGRWRRFDESCTRGGPPVPGLPINPNETQPRDNNEMELLDRLVKAVTGENIEANARHFARELGNAPESYANCLKDLERCADKTSARMIYLLCWRIIKEYKADLFKQAEGKWQSIPRNVVARIAQHYPEIKVDEVMFAPAIDTRHGNHITWGNRFFYSKSKIPDTVIDFTRPDHTSVMLHELEHVVQYHRRGEEEFLGEYIRTF